MEVGWQIYLLGGLRVEQDNRTITRFRTQKAGALLAYLAYHRHRAHLRDQLVELLWPEGDPQAGRSNLSRELSGLRNQLEPAGRPGARTHGGCGTVIVADRTSVRLNPDALTTDVAAFESALHAAECAGAPTERASHLAEAIETYSGELLPGYYDPWILQEREWLADRYFQALGQLLSLLQQAGELPRALEYARRGVRTDPLREEAQRDLMRLLAAAGQPEAALRQYRELERLLKQELEAEPSAAVREMAQAIEGGTWHGDNPTPTRQGATLVSPLPSPEAGPDPIAHGPALPPGPAGLPLQLTRFFGREQELARLRAMLVGEERRLVTLTGPGGSGKTRLGLEAATLLHGTWHRATWFVPLADIVDPRLIADAVLTALRLPRSPGAEPLEQVIAALSRQPALLLLDNFEHLVPEGTSLVRTLLERVPTLACLVTSRQRLGLAGEREFLVLPLSTPDTRATPEQLIQCESVQLFVDRAQATRLDFQVTRANAPAVAALCQRLEGIPLAIELAAARAGVLTPAQMLARLKDRYAFLVSRERDPSGRHRSLRAALDWSYRLLSPELQRFFTQLWVFRGGWTLAAAEAICQTPCALESLEPLRECSLVLAEEKGEETRFRLLETLREYGRECLATTEQETVRCRHAQFFLALAETAEPELCGAESATWLERLAMEQDNMRAALEWLMESDDAEAAWRLGRVLTHFWSSRGHWAEGRERVGRLLAMPGAVARTSARARALYRAGRLFYETSGCREGHTLLEESLAIGREVGEMPIVADALWTLGERALRNGDRAAALPLLEESLAIGQEMGAQDHIAALYHTLAEWHRDEGDLARASALYEASLALFQELGIKWAIAWTYKALGNLARQQGNYRAAQACYKKALGSECELGDRNAIVLSDLPAVVGLLGGLAVVASAEGCLPSAARLFGAAAIACEYMGVLQLPSEGDDYSRHAAAVRAALGEEAFAAAWAEGQAMSLEQAVAYAMQETAST
jgi:predicted ATPase/DNA-binding SARP family transcriptional activator